MLFTVTTFQSCYTQDNSIEWQIESTLVRLSGNRSAQARREHGDFCATPDGSFLASGILDRGNRLGVVFRPIGDSMAYTMIWVLIHLEGALSATSKVSIFS